MDHHLKHLANFEGSEGPVLCMVLDGFGIGKGDAGDCVHIAQHTNINRLMKEAKENNLYCELKAHGLAVGLPDDTDMGNSEVGHNALGAGQLIDQGSKLVGNVIADGSIFKSDNFNYIVDKVRHHPTTTVHLLGLLGDGNVHSHIDHLIAIINGLSRADVPSVRIHILTDGRDVSSMSALTYVEKLEISLHATGKDYRIATGGGRMYVTMDRYEADWQIVKRGWDVMVLGEVNEPGWPGNFSSTTEAINAVRLQFPRKTDQDYPPWVIVDSTGLPTGLVKDGDVVINFNFRGDRAIEISRAFAEGPDFDATCFARRRTVQVDYFGLLIYDNDKGIPKRALCPNPDIQNVMTSYLCTSGVTQYAVSETHKFGHVTYFWNGNRSGYFDASKELYEEVRFFFVQLFPGQIRE